MIRHKKLRPFLFSANFGNSLLALNWLKIRFCRALCVGTSQRTWSENVLALYCNCSWQVVEHRTIGTRCEAGALRERRERCAERERCVKRAIHCLFAKPP